MLLSEKEAVTAAMHFTGGTVFALGQTNSEPSTVGCDLFVGHLTDAFRILKDAVTETDPSLTFEALVHYFRMIQRSMSPLASNYALQILQLLEPERWLDGLHREMGFKA